jgi:hypothetical protein
VDSDYRLEVIEVKNVAGKSNSCDIHNAGQNCWVFHLNPGRLHVAVWVM